VGGSKSELISVSTLKFMCNTIDLIGLELHSRKFFKYSKQKGKEDFANPI